VPDDGDRVNSEMHSKAVIEQGLEMHLEAKSKWTQRCTWRL